MTRQDMGRPKGALNNENRIIRDMIKGALNKAGGSEYLYQQSQDNPTAFMSLIGKLIPAEISGEISLSHKFEPLIIKRTSE